MKPYKPIKNTSKIIEVKISPKLKKAKPPYALFKIKHLRKRENIINVIDLSEFSNQS